MLAAIFDHGTMRLEQRPIPRPKAGEALIQIRLAGICNTDIELLKGYMNFSGIPGHEFVGQVVEAPDAPEFVGARVTADINIGCGTCPTCRKADARHCPQRQTVGIAGHDGAFAEYLALPVSNLHRVPDTVTDEEAVFVEPLAAALEPSQQVHLTAEQSLLVLGDGKLGILCACGLRPLVPGLILAGRHVHKLAIAAAQGVATRLVDDASLLLTTFPRFDVVVEATGRPQGLRQALALVRPEGTVIAKTTTFAPTSLDMARLVVDEICLLGSRCGNFELAMAALQDRRVDVRPLIESIHPFSDCRTAMEAASRPGAMKVLLRFPENGPDQPA